MTMDDFDARLSTRLRALAAAATKEPEVHPAAATQTVRRVGRTRTALPAGAAAVAIALVLAIVVLEVRPGMTGSGTSTGRSPCPGQVVVRWYVSLTPGAGPDQTAAEQTFANAYNAASECSEPYLELEVVPGPDAYAVLKGEIASGNPPDIVGPIGRQWLNLFSGAFVDQSSLAGWAAVDVTRFPSAMLDFFSAPGTGLVGLPYVLYPAFIFYNKDIFSSAGLPDLPQSVGDQWNGRDWTWDALTDIAAQLTLDGSGRKSTQAGFDANDIVQFGIDFQGADAIEMASCFGGGSFVGDDGKAIIPTTWRAAWNWYYQAMWTRHIAPTGKYTGSALLDNGSTISSGRIAMSLSWGWQIGSYGSAGKAAFSKWGMAVLPSYGGRTSNPMEVGTFVITKASHHPEEALRAIQAIMMNADLPVAYGGMPASSEDQQAWISDMAAKLATVFPGSDVSWRVLQELENYPAVPSQDTALPNYLRSVIDYSTFFSRLQSESGLDVDKEIDALRAKLQSDFDAAGRGG